MDDMKYRRPLNTRRGFQSRTGRFRSAVLAPTMAVAVEGDEGGLLQQSLSFELDPIAGRMITPMYMEVVSVFVPVQDIDRIKDPNAQYAGVTEVVRQKLLTGAPLFNLEPEGEISRRCKVNPRSISGVKQVNECVRLAYNCAVNFLRRRRYDRAAQLPHTNAALAPAIVSQTVLQLLNGVLDPDDRVNGQVSLNLGNVLLPVEGIGYSPASISSANVSARETGQTADQVYAQATIIHASSNSANHVIIERDTATNQPLVFARLNSTVGNLSLDDFHNAQTADRLVREMRAILEEYPQFGEEYILRWAHGLKIENAHQPWVLAERRIEVGREMVAATDSTGVLADTMRTDSMGRVEWTVPIPRTELGGVIITMAALKPDETIAAMPHPFLTQPWVAQNFVADEMMLDPVPVQVRSMDSDCLQANENNVLFYIGHNALRRNIVDYGLSRQLNPATVANKTAVWQYALPVGVTPDNINYPANFPQTPFVDTNAEVVTYTMTSTFTMQTPRIFGPTPVEEMPIINAETLLTN